MSHLTTFESNVLLNCKKGLLTKAMKSLGYDYREDINIIKNQWITEKVDAGLVRLSDNKEVSVGFRFVKEGANTKLTLAGDFWGTGIDSNSFINKIAQQYKKEDVLFQCQQQGWTVNREDISIDNKTNDIVIRASRMVG